MSSIPDPVRLTLRRLPPCQPRTLAQYRASRSARGLGYRAAPRVLLHFLEHDDLNREIKGFK
eukprot:3734734-Rhodomonas_salina.1